MDASSGPGQARDAGAQIDAALALADAAPPAPPRPVADAANVQPPPAVEPARDAGVVPAGDAAGAQLATIWSDTDKPVSDTDPEKTGVELGLKFRASADGFVVGFRFYKGPLNTGVHTGRLWSAAGTLLASAPFAAETATGWQQVTLPTPVAITAGVTYVVSYFAPMGSYAGDNDYFAATGVTRGPLRALSAAEAAGNGVFGYTMGGFPTSSFRSSNYWVDVVFRSK